MLVRNSSSKAVEHSQGSLLRLMKMKDAEKKEGDDGRLRWLCTLPNPVTASRAFPDRRRRACRTRSAVVGSPGNLDKRCNSLPCLPTSSHMHEPFVPGRSHAIDALNHHTDRGKGQACKQHPHQPERPVPSKTLSMFPLSSVRHTSR